MRTGNRANNLERKLRHAIAIISERQAFKHNIGQAPIGGSIFRAFFGNNQRIGHLCFIAAIHADIKAGPIHQFAIGPDAPNIANRTLT